MNHIKTTYNFSTEKTGTHMLLLNVINQNSKVLDIGCASGYLGEYLINEKNCKLWGIEPDKKSYNLAISKGYKKLINEGIEYALNELVNEKFDYILAGDIFEHLVNPGSIISRLTKYIDDGRLVLSLPNVAHYSIRRSLLLGKWNMSETGILDKTHLHFYTLKTAKELLENSGWSVISMRPRGDTERWFRKIGIEKFGKFLIDLWPQFFAVQFVFVLKKK